MRIRICTLGLCLAALAAAPASAEQWSFATGVDYSNGDYGEAEDTTIVSAPLSATVQGDRWSVSVSAPYISIEGPGGIAPGGAGLGGMLNRALGGADGAATGPVEEQGWGDVTLGAALTPLVTDGGTSLTLSTRARLPTGDEERSLGVGETVGSFAGIVRQNFDNGVSLYGGVGYEYAFESEADGVFAAAGGETRIADRVLVGARVDWGEATSDLRRDAMEASLYAAFDAGDHVRILAYGGGGLSDTSPETTAGIGLVISQ